MSYYAISNVLEASEKAQAVVSEVDGISVTKTQRDMGQLLQLSQALKQFPREICGLKMIFYFDSLYSLASIAVLFIASPDALPMRAANLTLVYFI